MQRLNFLNGMPEHFATTIEQMNAGELYPHCPRCDGEREVYAITEAGNGFRPSRGEYFACPCCSHTGEADREQAKDFIENWCWEHLGDGPRGLFRESDAVPA